MIYFLLQLAAPTSISSVPEPLSLSITMFAPASPKSISFFPNHSPNPSPTLLKPYSTILTFPPKPHKLLKPISASQLPTPSPPPSSSDQLSQPFQPPPSSQPPHHQSLSPNDILHILRNRLGLWHQYAPHIFTLYHHFSFSDSAIEESTGISCVEQNRLIVAAQVRDSLIASQVGGKVVSFFDNAAGAELLYELQSLADAQLAFAARQIATRLVEDPKAAQKLARAMKDFPQWRGLDFTQASRSKKLGNESEWKVALQRSMEAAEIQWVKHRVPELCKTDAVWQAARAQVPVVSMKMEYVAEAASVVRMPLCRAEEGEFGVAVAPDHQMVGEFGVVMAEKPPGQWAVLPGWEPLLEIGGRAVVVRFKDGSFLPWELGGVFNLEDEILVVVKREKKAVVEEEGFHLVANSQDGGLRVVKGSWLKDKGAKDSLGIVVLVLRLPANAHDLQFLEDTPTKSSDNNAPHFQIPTVDFNGVNGDRRNEIVDEIRQASETWGFFQLVNHGIPNGILDNAIESSRRFHEQPQEAKSDITLDARKKPISNIIKNLDDILRLRFVMGNWRDNLTCVFHVDPPQPEEVPEICRDEILEYKKHVFKLGETIFGLISEALGQRTSYLQDLGCMKPMVIGCNYYRRHPWPELFHPSEHTDHVFLGIILQDHIGGLQVLHQQSWINVEPVRGALIVNIGEFLQLATNGKLKAAVHRVMANREAPRISITSFFNVLPPSDRMKEQISGENPTMHRS